MVADATVYVVDDDPAVRAEMERMLEDVEIPCVSFSSADEFLAAERPCGPACILLDIRMPGMGGLELHRRLAKPRGVLPIIVVTGHADITLAVEMLNAGAFGFYEKPVRSAPLLDCIRDALRHSAQSLHEARLAAEARARLEQLTEREHEVYQRLLTGKSNKDIAHDLRRAPQTIDAHRNRIFSKLNVRNVVQLVRLSVTAQSGWPRHTRDGRARGTASGLQCTVPP